MEPLDSPHTSSEVVTASIGERIKAMVIDHFLYSFGLAAIYLLLFMNDDFDDQSPQEFIFSLAAAMIPGMFLYLAKDAVKGVSLGKWLSGICVRDAENSEEIPSAGRLIKRNIPLLIWPVELIALSKKPKKQRIGDRLANTQVIQNPNAAPRGKRIVVAIATGLAIIALFTTSINLLFMNSEAYKVAKQEISMNEEILEATGGIEDFGRIISGSIGTRNGKSTAFFEMNVYGEDGDVFVSISLRKDEQNKWYVSNSYWEPIR